MSLQRLDLFFEVLQDDTPSIPGVGLMDVLIFQDRMTPVKRLCENFVRNTPKISQNLYNYTCL